MLIDEGTGGIASDVTAGFRFLLSEPTLHAFSPELVEDAVRNTYQADESGVVYSLVISGEALRFSQTNTDLIPTVAGQMAAVWNENARVPGVADIVETQETTPLGSLNDIFQVAVESTSGRSTGILTLTPSQIRPDVFAGIIAAEVAALNRNEQTRQMPGPNEPGYNVLTKPGTGAHKAWANFWKSVTVYNVARNTRTVKYTRAIRRTSR